MSAKPVEAAGLVREFGDLRAVDGIDLEVVVEPGETIWTEVSCKYTRESVERMLSDAGLELQHWFTGEDRAFALSLSRLA